MLNENYLVTVAIKFQEISLLLFIQIYEHRMSHPIHSVIFFFQSLQIKVSGIVEGVVKTIKYCHYLVHPA